MKQFSDEEQREIVFTDIDTGGQSHITRMDTEFNADLPERSRLFRPRRSCATCGWSADRTSCSARSRHSSRNGCSTEPVDLEDLNILRNLSEIAATRTIFETFKKAINELTVVDRGTSLVRDRIKMSQVRPYAVKSQNYVPAKKSIFNKVVGDSQLRARVRGLPRWVRRHRLVRQE